MKAGYKNEGWANDDIELKRRDVILELKPKGTTKAPGSSCRTLSGELLDSQPQIRNDLGLKSAIQDKVLRGLPN